MNLSKMAGLVGSWYRMAHSSKKWLKERQPLNQRQSLLCSRLTDVRWECKCSPSGPIPLKSYCSTNCWEYQCWLWLTACYVLNWVATDQSWCPCYTLSTAESTSNGHKSVRTGTWSHGRRGTDLMNHVFFYISWKGGCVFVVYLGVMAPGFTMGSEAGRDCDALGYVLLMIGSWHSCGWYFDTFNLPIHCGRPSTTFPHNYIPWWQWTQQDNTPCHNAKLDQKWYEITGPIHRGPTLELTGFKEYAADILVSDTIRHLQRSSWVHASIGQHCIGGTSRSHTILRRWC